MLCFSQRSISHYNTNTSPSILLINFLSSSHLFLSASDLFLLSYLKMDTSAAKSCTTTTTVQRVNKKSSDELLRKFAEVGEDHTASEAKKRRKIRSKTWKEGGGAAAANEYSYESPAHYTTTTLVERRSLLPQLTRKSVLLRQLGIGRSQLRAKDIKNKSILVAIEKVIYLKIWVIYSTSLKFNEIHNLISIF